MTALDKLDKVLQYLDNDLDHRETFTHIKEKLDFNISDKDLELLLDKLHDDGYVQKSPTKSGGQPDGKFCYNITYQGRSFLSNTFFKWTRKPYIQKRGINRLAISWTVAKTAAVIANALIIIFISIWAAKLSSKSDLLKEELSAKDRLLNERQTTIEQQSVTIEGLERKLLEQQTRPDTTNK